MGIVRVIDKLAFPLSVCAFGALLFLQKRRPLRTPVESETLHSVRNLLVAGTAGAAMFLLEKPVASRAAGLVERRDIGLLKLFRLPRWLDSLAAVLLLDYTLYLWHVLTHRVRFLWRFHVVHHSDLDLDTTTALRFHFCEITLSVGWRIAQILVIGVSPIPLKIWQALLLPSVLFHHANVDLSNSFESNLSKILVTPRMHGLHHSIIQDQTNSNWSSGLSIWDRIHGTFRDISEHRDVTIGVPGYRTAGDLTFEKLLELPFREQPQMSPFPENVNDE